MTAGQKVPIEQGLIARVSGKIWSVFTGGKTTAFMGPNEPLPVMVQNPEQAGTLARQTDYPTGYNINYRPRSTETTTFQQLRALADNCDILRTSIETRKDAIDNFKFSVKPRDGGKANRKCKQIQDFLRFPNGEHDFATWARAVIEDMLVIDAVTIYPWKTNGGDLYKLELIDGATITRLIDVTGRTPAPPNPAYQQIIKGIVAADYTSQELVYMPRNVRTHKIYGHSVVEQIVMTVNTAIRRTLHQLQFYTEGSTPDLIFSLPPEWSIDQIKEFESHWNGMLSGDTAARRQTRFVPGGVTPVNTKEGALQDAFDEWLARVICYAMNVPNHWAIKQQTRAGQGVEQSSADQRGDEITKAFLKALLDRIIAQHFNAPELALEWDVEEEIDPEARARVQDIKLRNGSLALNEARADDNRDPVEGGDVPMFATATGYVPIKVAAEDGDNPNDPQDNPPEDTGKVAKVDDGEEETEQVDGRGAVTDLPQDQDDTTKKALAAIIAAFLADWWGSQKALIVWTGLEAAMASIDTSGFAALGPLIEPRLRDIAFRGVADAAKQAGSTPAQKAAAEADAIDRLKKRIDDLLKPGGSVSIADSTVRMLQPLIDKAIQSGDHDIDGGYATSQDRANVIAENEGNEARQLGKSQTLIASKVLYKRWNAYPGCCNSCRQLSGTVVPMDDDFVAGVKWPPLHTNCRCDIDPFSVDVETGEIS